MAGDPGLSHTTLVIVAACASVAGLIILYAAFQFSRALRRRAAVPHAPLPPIQPLAHRRATLQKYDDRATWYSPSSPAPTDFSPSTTPRLPLPAPSFLDKSSPSPSSSESHLTNYPVRPPPRPLSASSFHSSSPSAVSRRPSRQTLRGAPHAPHNNLQIILPTPLAPALSPRSRPNSFRADTEPFVDKWVPVSRDSTSSPSRFPPPSYKPPRPLDA